MKGKKGTLFDFDPLADVYEDWYKTAEGRAHDHVQQQDVQALLPPASSGESLLDVGCGTGHWSRFFHSMGYDVQGIDLSEKMIAVARQMSPGCRFETGDAQNLPFENGSYDVTASITALEFVPDQPAVVSEMARCTRPGGLLLIGTLNRAAPINRDRLAAGSPPFSLAQLLNPADLLKLVQPLGKVRMAASVLPGPGPGSVFTTSGTEPAEMGALAGALIVACVSLDN
ncbi:MAG: class I SAM-dependent methyltransferase [Pseudomonadota bacterium]|jgi:SAM-dependent methyltransferase